MKTNEDKLQQCYGKVIQGYEFCGEIDESRLTLIFADDVKVVFADTRLDCCEKRYLRTDDYLGDLVGHRFLGYEIQDGGTTETEWSEEHQIQFLDIITDRGRVQLACHNEHNGCYGGFDVEVWVE